MTTNEREAEALMGKVLDSLTRAREFEARGLFPLADAHGAIAANHLAAALGRFAREDKIIPLR